MFFTVGQKVILKYTNDEGIVKALLPDGMVMVQLHGEDMEIPVFEEDLRVATTLPLHKSPALPQHKNTIAPVFNVQTQYGILQSLGLQLGFEAIMKYENIDRYLIYLINDTPSDVVFLFRLSLNGQVIIDVDNKINSLSVHLLGELNYSDLVEIPEATIEVKEITTEGLGKPLTKTLKLRPQNFYKNVIVAPLLNKIVHHFVLFQHFQHTAIATTPNKEDLKSYTKRVSHKQEKPPQPDAVVAKKLSKHDIEEFANFNPEIDLHIENLIANYSGMSNSEIIKIQLQHFDKFMQKAYRLGVPKVFVIHGIGKGKLRDEIATKLLQEYTISTFKNDYHPKYGFGATEIIF